LEIFGADADAAPPPPAPSHTEEQTAAVLHALVAAALGSGAGCVAETAALLRKDAENSYGVMAPFAAGRERQLRANAVFETASRVNHSCTPNVARFDYVDRAGPLNLRVFLRALERIDVRGPPPEVPPRVGEGVERPGEGSGG
jgi:hypothetical protein